MQALYDVVIVGSGPAAIHAALPLIESGSTVAVLCPGRDAAPLSCRMPDAPFDVVRACDSTQQRLFLGDDASGVAKVDRSRGASEGRSATPRVAALSWLLSGNRAYITKGAERWFPLRSKRARVIESVSRGGLGAAWGGVCSFMDARDLATMGLPDIEFDRLYREITSEIGVSGPSAIDGIQPPSRLDDQAASLWQRYASRRNSFARDGIELRRTDLALLTQDLGDRRACRYTEMHHFSDPHRSLYRPQYTLEHLQESRGFELLSGLKAVRFVERANLVDVETRDADGRDGPQVSGRRLVLAAGAIGTARVVLSSVISGPKPSPLPLLIKSHDLVACWHPRMLGRRGSAERIGLAQLLLRESAATVAAPAVMQLYGYRAFQLFRLLPNLPLPVPQAMDFASLLTPSLVIGDLRYATDVDERRAQLRLASDQCIEVEMLDAARTSVQRDSRRRFAKSLRRLGLWPVRWMSPPPGSPSHYAGTLPFDDAAKPGRGTRRDGRLAGCERVHVGDGSSFRALPAASPTMTIMANARRVGLVVARELAHGEEVEAQAAPFQASRFHGGQTTVERGGASGKQD